MCSETPGWHCHGSGILAIKSRRRAWRKFRRCRWLDSTISSNLASMSRAVMSRFPISKPSVFCYMLALPPSVILSRGCCSGDSVTEALNRCTLQFG
eukprot:6179079-Pleurochrysis_carterae.AAC.2